MKVVIVYLDDEGIECYREVLSESKAKEMYGKVIDRMMKEGKWYDMLGDKVIMLER